MIDEFEVVQHPQISNLNLFVVSIDYRSPHLHRDFELDLIISGEVVLISQNQSYQVPAGGLILLGPNQPHELRTAERPATVLCLQMSPRLLQTVFPVIESICFDTMLPAGHLTPEDLAAMRRRFVELAIPYLNRARHYEILCMGLLNLLVYDLLQKLPSHTVTPEERRASQKRVERLNRIMRFVEENHAGKVRLQDIARQEGLSLSYLSHFVHDNLNQTFQEYVSSVRFNVARKLLIAGGKRLLDICIESGFSDPRYLAKAFVENTGMLPEEYRRRHGQVQSDGNFSQPRSSQQYIAQSEAAAMLSDYLKQTGI